MRVRLVPVSDDYQSAFLAAARRSRTLHHPWVQAPQTAAQFRAYLAKRDGERNLGFFALGEDDELVGVINLNEIVRGNFRSAYMGYYVFAPHAGRGLMTVAVGKMLTMAFGKLRLHRVEANIQPGNRASRALVKRLGFRKEGLSPGYLKIAGKWRDHERWAITRDEWTRRGG